MKELMIDSALFLKAFVPARSAEDTSGAQVGYLDRETGDVLFVLGFV